MEIQQKQQLIMEQASSDSSDSWDPQLPSDEFLLSKKINIKFDDRTIDQNIDNECLKPILNQQIFRFDQEEQENDKSAYETCDENSTFQSEQNQKMHKTTHSTAENNQSTKQPSKEEPMNLGSILKEQQKQQALFDAVEDEQNEKWMQKNLKSISFPSLQNSQYQSPLSCPQCFTQFCYNYQKTQHGSVNGTNKTNRKTFQYHTKSAINITVNEHKIIRNRFSSERMQSQKPQNFNLQKYFTQNQSLDCNSDLTSTQESATKAEQNQFLSSYATVLKQRYDDFNIKVVVSCEQCLLEIGFWDINRQQIVLIDVI